MFIKILLTVIFLAVTVYVGIYSRKQARGVEGFVLGGRTVGPWLTAFAYGTSYFSAVVFVGYAGQFGWKYGFSSSWIGVGNAIIGSLLAWMILGRRTKLMTQHIESRTMPDFFGTRYNSQRLRVIASVIAFVFLIPYTAGVYKGISTLFEMGFGIPYQYCVILMAVLTAVYVILGGYKATALNDFIQGIIMLVGIVAVIAAVLASKGGLTTALTNERAIKRGTIISTLFAFIVAGGCYFLGGCGRLFDTPPTLPNGRLDFDAIVPGMLSTLPDILIALVVLLVLSASMSTLASLVLTSSSTMTLDLIYRDKKSLPGEVEEGSIDDIVAEKVEARKVIVMRVLIVFFIAISLLIALNPPTFIAQLMGISWGALAGAFLAPFLMGLYWKKVTPAAVWTCFIWGVGFTVVNMLSGNAIANPINAGAIAMLGGFPVVYIVSLFTPKLRQSYVDNIFNCYKKKLKEE